MLSRIKHQSKQYLWYRIIDKILVTHILSKVVFICKYCIIFISLSCGNISPERGRTWKKIRGLKTFQQYRMFKTCAQIAKHSAISLNRIRYFEIQKNRTEILMFCRASVTEFLAKIRDHVGARVRVQLRFSVSPKVGSGKKWTGSAAQAFRS